ncbi:MAG TPA: ParB/RepB/Spo0J family partition protein [Saprospiraceae bacterium]|nr:ParB/RepB/Spo0J family partition protein [Saprospiraceae bacterium]HMP14207.1 ParB/RepB/Spo0J family partition protein [Saprospiraceae bacterium]
MAKKIDKKQLGMGVRALLANIETETSENQQEIVRELSHTVAMIPLHEIEVNPFQPRNEFDEAALAELSASIQVHGLIQPITVRRLSANEYQLISGERRLRASKMAGLEEIPAYIRLANDQEMLEMALVENIQRENLNAIEIAITYQRLKEECNLTDEALASRVGKQRSTVTNHMRLLKLPPDIQKAIKDKQISMGHARVLAGVDDFALQNSLFRETLRQGLSVRALETLASAHHGDKPRKSKPSLPDAYEDIQRRLREHLGTPRVQLKLKGEGKGQIVIGFDSNNQLNDLLEQFEA